MCLFTPKTQLNKSSMRGVLWRWQKKAHSQCYAALKTVTGKIKYNEVELAANFGIFFPWPGRAEQIFSMTQPENSPLAMPRGA